MEKFIVSARKYRPQIFNTVIGQSHITTTLKNAIANNQLAHAFLFCGPRGVGKTTCARILAKTINCLSRTADNEACDKCNSCTSFNEGSSLNIHELDAASNNSVDDIRVLVDQVRFSPQAGQYKVYIVDEVHMLSASAFNAFLKTLEEPPAHAIFILATTEKHKILPTILSRCQIFDFKRITNTDTVEHLNDICKKEKINAEPAALQVIAQKSEGCLRDSLSIMDKIVSFTSGELNYKNTLEHLNILDEDYYFNFLEHFTTQSLPDALLLYDEINKKGFEGDTLLQGMQEFIRNLLVCKDEKSAQLIESIESFRKKYIATAKTLESSWLITTLNLLSEAEITYKQSRHKKLHVEMLLIKLCYLNQALEVAAGGVNTTFKRSALSGPIAVSYKKINSLTSLITTTKLQPTAPTTQATLTIQPSIVTSKQNTTYVTPTTSTTTAIPKKQSLTALKNIREQVRTNTSTNNIAEVKNITLPEVEQIWRQTGLIASNEGNLQTVKVVFDSAILTLTEQPNTFTIQVGSHINSKTVEEYKNTFMLNLQQHFNNRNIAFSIIVVANTDNENDNTQPIKISARESYNNIVTQYPNVQLLKDALGLTLDY